MRTPRILAILVFFLGSAAIGRPALAHQDQPQSGTGDPVADAARRVREQKKSAPKPKKVFTDDDVAAKPAIAPSNTPANADVATSAQAVADESKTEASSKKEDSKSEAYWRKRFAAQRKKIADIQQELDVLQREADKADVQYYSDPQKAMNEQFTRKEINEKNDKIAAKKKEIADLTQQLSDMEDELRRAGGDPGWAR